MKNPKSMRLVGPRVSKLRGLSSRGRYQVERALAAFSGAAARAFSAMPGAWFAKVPTGTRPLTLADLDRIWMCRPAVSSDVSRIYAHRGEAR